MNKYISISNEVNEAIKNKKPIVALESTIISHGMPYPQNVETALEAQRIVRENGAIPATIAIINGICKIGLSDDEINYLGYKGQEVLKTSSRDIPYVISKKLDGATTVSATARIASFVGIKIFATGGIGGVHRGAQNTFDISSDLDELSSTNVNVVCAGAKSILDLGLTLEYLETKRVEVIGYKTEVLPAFYTSKSDFKVNHRLDSPEEIGELINSKNILGINSAILITNPIPKEYEMDETIIKKAIDEAIVQMNELGIIGNKTTPYLLAKIKEITKGNSLESNIKLVYNNCKLASQIAKYIY